MTASETQAILTVSLLAAFADGDKHERERAEIKRIAEGLSQADAAHLPTLYQDVLMKRVSLATALPALVSDESKQLAYEMAACVCDADGAQSAAERAFLAELGSALGLSAASATQFSRQAEELAAAPLSSGSAARVTDHAELDAEILNAAILNGSRRRRIALGSGVSVADVNRFLKQFQQTKKMMKHVESDNQEISFRASAYVIDHVIGKSTQKSLIRKEIVNIDALAD